MTIIREAESKSLLKKEDDFNMEKTIEQKLDDLKENWLADPVWDIEETEGFEDYKEELLQFRLQQEKIWGEQAEERERKIDEKARELGIEGLYCILLEHKNLLQRQALAIECLANNNSKDAFRALSGYFDSDFA